MLELVFYTIFAAIIINLGVDLHIWFYQDKKIKHLEEQIKKLTSNLDKND